MIVSDRLCSAATLIAMLLPDQMVECSVGQEVAVAEWADFRTRKGARSTRHINATHADLTSSGVSTRRFDLIADAGCAPFDLRGEVSPDAGRNSAERFTIFLLLGRLR